MCLLKAGRLQTPGTFLFQFYSPAASSAINDLAYNISVMKNRTEAPSRPTYWSQFIKSFMLFGDVKLGLSVIECLGNQVSAIRPPE